MRQKKGFRKLINDIHLWLGIASGLVLFVVCLSGTIYTFHTEVEEWFDRKKFFVEVPNNTQPIPLETLIPQLEQKFKGRVSNIEFPAKENRAYKVVIAEKKQENKEAGKKEQAAPEKKKGRSGKTFYINPYTGETTGKDGGKVADFFVTMMKLHRWLLMEGEAGKIIVGVSTIIFSILCLTGLVLWFPKKIKYWKQGLKIRTSGNWKRTNHDLHNTLGFYSFILLLIMSLTGLCWSFEWYRNGVSQLMGAEVFKGRKEKPMSSEPRENTKPIPVSKAIHTANTAFPYNGNLRISFPAGKEGSFVISKYKTGFFALSASDKIQIDQYSGATLKLDRFSDKPLNEKIVDSIRPLHLGDITGTSSKILWFLACLIATSLPVTGTLIWINKLRKKPGKKKTENRLKTGNPKFQTENSQWQV